MDIRRQGIIFMNKYLKITFYLMIFAFLGLTIFIPAVGYLVYKDLPSLETLVDYKPPQSTQVFDRSNKLVGQFFDEKRTVIDIKKIPKHVVLSFIAAEDAEFYHHKGIDVIGLARAVMLEVKYRLFGGRRVGGSTITQQTARTMLLSSTKTYLRKLKEMVLARKIEETLTKDQILSLYLNQIYFGNGAYGIEEASKTYFHKSASKLEIFEAAALASIPKSPNRINPFADVNRLKDRQKYVLEQMLKHQYITPAEFSQALDSPLFSASNYVSGEEEIAPYFLRSIKNELLVSLADDYIRRGGIKIYSTLDNDLQKLANKTLRTGLESIDKKEGYRGAIFRPIDDNQKKDFFKKLEDFKKRVFVRNNKEKIWNLCHLGQKETTQNIDSIIDNIRLVNLDNAKKVCVIVKEVTQNNVVLDLGTKIVRMDKSQALWALSVKNKNKLSDIMSVGDIIFVELKKVSNDIKASLEQLPLINGALVALDVKTGGILAMTGGYDFALSQFNRAVQAKRQVGSTIKPFVYALAFDMNLVTAASIVTDAPKAFIDTETQDVWSPRNHDNKFSGDITVATGLVNSRNIITITLLEKIGMEKFLQFIKDVQINTEKTPFARNLTIALGSGENYPIQIANALRIFPNQGKFSPHHMIDKIKFLDGKNKSYTPSEEISVLQEESAFITTWLLKRVLYGKQHRLSNVKAEIAGKTGTTNKARTTWFYGYSPEILVVVYVGYDDNRSIGTHAWGINTAFPIWADFMNQASINQVETKFVVPQNIEWRYIDQKTGKAKPSLKEEILPTVTTDDDAPAAVISNSVLMEPFKAGSAPKIEEKEDETYSVPINNIDSSSFAP